jgi:hypothetical protein
MKLQLTLEGPTEIDTETLKFNGFTLAIKSIEDRPKDWLLKENVIAILTTDFDVALSQVPSYVRQHFEKMEQSC